LNKARAYQITFAIKITSGGLKNFKLLVKAGAYQITFAIKINTTILIMDYVVNDGLHMQSIKTDIIIIASINAVLI